MSRRCLFSRCPSPAPARSPSPLSHPGRPGKLPAPAAGGAGAAEQGRCRDAFGQEYSGAGAVGGQMRGAFPGSFPSPCPPDGPGAPAAAPGRRRCRRCPAAFVREWRGGAGTRLLVFTADVFSLTQRLYSGWWPTAESVSRCYLHSLFYGGLKYLYSSNLYRADKINFFFSPSSPLFLITQLSHLTICLLKKILWLLGWWSGDKGSENNFHFNNCLLVNLTVPYFERACLNEIPVPNVFPGLSPAFNYS